MTIIIPATANATHDLLTDVKARHTFLGASSPITNILAEKGISLVADLSTVDDAASHDHSASLFRKNAKAYGQVAANKAKPPMKVAGTVAQLIKSTNKKNLSVVGEWGFNITNSGKITLPTDAAACVQLFDDIIAKHNSYAPGTSPIAQYLIDKDIDLDRLRSALVDAQEFEKRMKDTYELAKNDRKYAIISWRL